MAAPSAPTPPASPALDPDRTLGLCCASIQCYNAYVGGAAFPADPLRFVSAPPGMVYADFWWGVDVFDGNKIHQEVVFGLAFTGKDDPGDVVFAFRGTEGLAEWLDDAHIGEVPFTPDGGGSLPPDARVEHGFDEIYASMQSSLFALLDRLAPRRLTITGHSLGSSLATIFTLDVALSRPGLAMTALNFASPRVGNEGFASFYQQHTAGRGNPTVRVINSLDLVPHLPPYDFGYRHIGIAAPICFEAPGFHVLPDYGLRHVADNYFRALCNHFGREQCDCRLEAADHGVKLRFCTPKANAGSLR